MLELSCFWNKNYIYSSIHLSIYTSIHPFIYSYIYSIIHLSIHPSTIHPFVHPFIHPLTHSLSPPKTHFSIPHFHSHSHFSFTGNITLTNNNNNNKLQYKIFITDKDPTNINNPKSKPISIYRHLVLKSISSSLSFFFFSSSSSLLIHDKHVCLSYIIQLESKVETISRGGGWKWVNRYNSDPLCTIYTAVFWILGSIAPDQDRYVHAGHQKNNLNAVGMPKTQAMPFSKAKNKSSSRRR